MKKLYAALTSLFVLLLTANPVYADVAPMPLGMPEEQLTVILLVLAAAVVAVAAALIIRAVRKGKRNGDQKK